MNRLSRLLLAAGTVACTALPASAQSSSTVTPLQRQLARVDVGIAGMGEFTKSVSGVVPNNGTQNSGANVTESASKTLGALANIRYVARPYIGVEFNYTYARFDENFTVQPLRVQTNVDEYSFGYLATPPHPVFGLQPFVSVGAGSTRFKPTAGGGENVASQWRATYYYSVGVQQEFGDSHFGVRAAFRQAFYKAPDFLENYLTVNQRTNTIEPTIGVFLRF